MHKVFSMPETIYGVLGVIVLAILILAQKAYSNTLNNRSKIKKRFSARVFYLSLIGFFALIGLGIFLHFKSLQSSISPKTLYESKVFLLDENFSNNFNRWDTRTTLQGKTTITNGTLQMHSTSNMIRGKTVSGLAENSNKISIKAEFNGKILSANGYFGLCWGLSDTDGLFIVFQGNGYKIGEINNHKWVFFNDDWLSSNLVSSRSLIALEIVKKNRVTEFYLDGNLLTSLKGMNFQGDEIGFVTNAAEMAVDFVRVTTVD